MAKAVAAVRLKGPYLLEGNETLSKHSSPAEWAWLVVVVDLAGRVDPVVRAGS
jgi:hypothetical protein